jgi:triosephosphate isomerase (TIM)
MRKLIAGNWKMNGTSAALGEVDSILAGLRAADDAVDVMICPPATLLSRCSYRAAGGSLLLGGQDCHPEPEGAHTGDISAEMLADAGAAAVIVGHSERRANHGESDALVCAKAAAAHRAGLTPIICVGETEAERDAGRASQVVEGQLAGSLPDTEGHLLIIAYEPVWAIGTGRTPSEGDIAAMHAHICQWLVARFGTAGEGVRVLYGGSMKPDNAAAILGVANVDGGLVGGASLKATDFLAIVKAAAQVAGLQRDAGAG